MTVFSNLKLSIEIACSLKLLWLKGKKQPSTFENHFHGNKTRKWAFTDRFKNLSACTNPTQERNGKTPNQAQELDHTYDTAVSCFMKPSLYLMLNISLTLGSEKNRVWTLPVLYSGYICWKSPAMLPDWFYAVKEEARELFFRTTASCLVDPPQSHRPEQQSSDPAC